MKKLAIIILLSFVYSCSTNKNLANRPLFEVLTFKNDGGAKIKFYEVLTEPKEIIMLMADSSIRNKINENDLTNCNFVILNLGELPEGNNSIEIESVKETSTNIEIKIKEDKTRTEEIPLEAVIVRPYEVLKINSKKPIIFK